MKNQKSIILPIGYNGTDGTVITGEQIEVVFFDLKQTINNLKSVMKVDFSCVKQTSAVKVNLVDGDEHLKVLSETIVYYPEGYIVIQFNIKHIEQELLETELLTLETLLSWTDC